MASRTRKWMKALFLLPLLVLKCQSQHSPHVQIVPLPHPISLDTLNTRGLPAVQRFRQILKIDQNHQRPHGLNRFPQSASNPPESQQNLLKIFATAGIPELSRAPTPGISPSQTQTRTLRPPQTVVNLNTQTPFPRNSTPNHPHHVPTLETHKQNSPAHQKGQIFQNSPDHTLHVSEKETPKSLPIIGPQSPTKQKFLGDPQLLELPAGLRAPEAPRVPELPAHLPLDLTNRLQEFPSLMASIDQAPNHVSMHSFFEPTLEVQSEELTDAEWQQYLASEWGSDGVVPSLLATPPSYVVNVNYGGHLCLHLGNTITPAQARHAPKSFQFPGDETRQYTVMLLDLDHPRGTYINWLLINVPLNQLHKGMEIIQYDPPRPPQGTGAHRMVFLVYLQQTTIPTTIPSLPSARVCESFHREGVDLVQLTRDLGLKGPTAANYYTTEWDITVEHACSST